jgi:NOL1/NOP2/sun family putative RNA methylase
MENRIPEFLKEKLIKQYGEELTDKIIEGYFTKRNLTFRINPLKTTKLAVIQFLNSQNIEYSDVSWYEDAIIIENVDESVIRETDMYKNGEIYLQSLSSMIPPIILEPKDNENILDMAAAPGGKTTEMYALSKGKANITACEKNKIRAERLKYNIEKQGATRIGVLMQDARRLDPFFMFDKILLDAPCSGSGTIDLNDEKNVQNFTEELVNRSVKVQKELIDKALKHIRVGKEMVYSTCSILHEENESYLEDLIKRKIIEIIPIEMSQYEEIPVLPVTIKGTLCVCPTQKYEGFYVARIKRIK